MNKYIQILSSGTNTLEYALAMPSINGYMPSIFARMQKTN